MIDLLIHPKTARQLASIQSGGTHAIMLVGGDGMGKKTIARTVVREVLSLSSLDNQPYVTIIEGDNDTVVGIEQIRELRQFLKRKTTGNGTLRRACLVYDADTMTSEAANALLKTLEEPPEDTLIVLTASNESAVPVTIRSRVQTVVLSPVSLDAATHYAGFSEYSSQDITNAYRLSAGRPALLTVLLAETSDHALRTAIVQAKELLSFDVYERLCRVDIYAKDKPATHMLLTGLERIASSLVQLAAEQNDHARLKRAHKTSSSITKAQQALSQNASTKLVLTDLFANM